MTNSSALGASPLEQHGLERGLAVLAAVAFLAGSTLACSASPPPADASEATPAPAPSESESTEPETADSSTAEVHAPNCDDGTCFVCGEGLCPKGAYCDQSASGGAACAWIQECPGDPSCSCLTKVFGSACSCEQAPSAAFVTCG